MTFLGHTIRASGTEKDTILGRVEEQEDKAGKEQDGWMIWKN